MSETQTALQRRIAMATAPAWRPEANETITGTLAAVSQYEHPEYGSSHVLLLENNKGQFLAVYLIHETLTTRIVDELKPQIGDMLTIAYLGRIESNSRLDANGNPVKYHAYHAFVGDPNVVEAASVPW